MMSDQIKKTCEPLNPRDPQILMTNFSPPLVYILILLSIWNMEFLYSQTNDPGAPKSVSYNWIFVKIEIEAHILIFIINQR